MASRFWVGGTATWDATVGTKWATTTGGAGGAAVPTASDDVFLDAASGAGTVTLSSTSVCLSLNCTGFTGTLSHPAATTLTIGSGVLTGASSIALKLVSGMTYTTTVGTQAITFASSSSTVQTVDTGGKTVGSFTFQSSGKWQFVANCTSSGTISFSNGVLDLNGKTFSLVSFTSSNTNTRTLTMGAASITCTAGLSAWNFSITTGLIVTANTATLTVIGNTVNFNGGGQDYNGMSLVFTGAGGTINGSNTLANLTFTGTAVKTNVFTLPSGATQTLTGTFACNGNNVTNRILLQSSTVGTAATINAAATSVTNTDFVDITAAGAANWDLSAISGGSGDCQGNSGIIFTAPQTNYYKSTFSANWSATVNWFLATNGGGGAGRVPLPQDTAIVDANSGSNTKTWDMPRSGKDIDFTGFTGISKCGTGGSSLFGSLTFASGMTTSTDNIVMFQGRATHTVSFNGVTLVGSMSFTSSGTYTLTGYTSTSAAFLTHTAGTLTLAGNTTCPGLTDNGTLTRTLNLGSGTPTLNSTTALAFDIQGAGLTLNAQTSTLSLIPTGPTATQATQMFGGYTGLTLNTVKVGLARSGGYIAAAQCTLARLQWETIPSTLPPTISLTSATSFTFTDITGLSSVSGAVATINATTGGSAAILFTSGGAVAFVNLTDQTLTATGVLELQSATATNVAASGNVEGFDLVDGGGNTGIQFYPYMPYPKDTGRAPARRLATSIRGSTR